MIAPAFQKKVHGAGEAKCGFICRKQEKNKGGTAVIHIRRALLSVTDKIGLDELARGLARWNVELISTGGTARMLTDAGLTITNVSEVTGFPEMLDGRVKTLHPAVHGGILADRSKPEHLKTLAAHGIGLIDLVVVNLYPFTQTIARPNVTRAEAIENIDIGGPTLIRSAAKNSDSVAVVVNPTRYPAILREMQAHDGALSLQTRESLAAEAFAHTASYDAAIANYLSGTSDHE